MERVDAVRSGKVSDPSAGRDTFQAAPDVSLRLWSPPRLLLPRNYWPEETGHMVRAIKHRYVVAALLLLSNVASWSVSFNCAFSSSPDRWAGNAGCNAVCVNTSEGGPRASNAPVV
jgi:hypothetical protein